MLQQLIGKIRGHSLRLRHHLGARVSLGPRDYRLRGYFSNILEVDSPGEPEVRAVLERILAARQGHFIDVGANLGQTLGCVLSIDPARDYLGFEPQVSACFFVQRFLQDNGLRQAQILPIGLSDSDGIRRFWVAGEADVFGSLIERSGQDMREIAIAVRRGDVVLAEIGVDKIAVIKIDVEGAERDVIAGLRGTLRKHLPPVLFEVLPNFEGEDRRPVAEDIARRQSSAAEALAELLHELGYRIFNLDANGTEVPIDRFDLDDRTGHLGSNFVAWPVSRTADQVDRAARH